MKKECVLYDRLCINCGECDVCDLDPKKTCDNCGKCIDSGDDYNIMDVDLTVENGDEPLNYHYEGEENSDSEFEEESFIDDDFDEVVGEDDFEDDFEDDEDEDDLRFDFGEFFGQR